MTALDPSLLLQGYATGVFPMADDRDAPDVFWVEPRERTILPLDRFHVSHSLAKRIRSERYRVTCDRDFVGVIEGCADRPETWISHPIEDAMLRLHHWGHAHSVEVWADGRLVGGVYGVKLGRAFFGESMFSRERDASKVALAWLVARLRVGRFTLLDCQFMTDHLASLGAIAVPRADYVAFLAAALARAGASPPDWTALDGLLSSSSASPSIAAPGKLITQLLGQTS